MGAIGAQTMYDARLDLLLLTRGDQIRPGFTPIARCAHENAHEAVRRAFDAAERELQTIAATARRADGAGD
jgi:hypothetical protein